MNDKNAPDTLQTAHSSSIEFKSLGRFSVSNPDTPLALSPPIEPAPFVIGEHSTIERFDSREQAQAHALALFQQARRTLCLYTDELEPWLFNHSSIEQSCIKFLIEHPRNQLQILLRDSSRAVQQGHRLINLSKRISSNFQIRKLHPDYPNERVSFLVVDNRACLVLPEPNEAKGYALYDDAVRNRRLRAQFDQAWQTSLSDSNLRQFLI